MPAIVAEAGAKGVPAAIIISAGLGHGAGSLAEACAASARANGLRLVGPNCIGLLSPPAKLNASFTTCMPGEGDLALVSQSGAITAALVEWSAAHGVGFSGIVSLGDRIDVDFGDLLDYFALDRRTRAILLYIESINYPASSCRRRAPPPAIKPVVVIKSGRHALGAKAAQTHTGALAGSDEVYDAAFRRAGLLRVIDMDELFAAAETLGRVKPFVGNRLAILTNGGGIGVLAVDRLADLGGTLAGLSPGTLQTTRRGAAADLVARQPGRHRRRRRRRTLCQSARTAAAGSGQRRRAGHERADRAGLLRRCRAERSRRSSANIAPRHTGRSPSSPTGPAAAIASRRSSRTAGIPSYPTETDAVRGFMHLVRYREALDTLMATPPNLPVDFKPDVAAARASIATALESGRTWLDPTEITALLAAYDIPSRPRRSPATPMPRSPRPRRSWRKGITVVAKISSPDIVHKSEVGGVRLNLTNEAAVRTAVTDILGAGPRGAAGRADRRRHHSSDDPAPEGARADRRARRRSDLRSGGGVRKRRNGGRGDRRQGAGAAAARSRAGA